MKSNGYLRYVNTRMGSRNEPRFSNGNTLPFAQRPFGMAGFVLQTGSLIRRCEYFYDPDAYAFEGFRLSHQPSPWIGDHAALLIQPQAGQSRHSEYDHWAGFDKRRAILDPDYISLYVARWRINAELTPTERGCVMRFRFDHPDKQPKLAFFCTRSEASFTIDPEKRRVYGWTNDCPNWQVFDENRSYKEYFVAELDCDIDAENCDRFDPAAKNGEGDYVKALHSEGEKCSLFAALKSRDVRLRMGISFISLEQAELNMERETSFDFDAVRAEANDAWEKKLSSIEAECATEEEMKTFYSCLYRVMCYPHKCYEIDAGGNEVHYCPFDATVRPGKRYTDSGFWDTFRTVFPLLSIILPDDYAEIVEGFVTDYVDHGWLPRWTAMGESGAMPSTMIDSVIADGAVKGILKGKLLETAFEGMLKNASVVSPDRHFGRNAVGEYMQYGYVPHGAEYDVVNLTLDFAYCDFCVAQVAHILGKYDIENEYRARANNYKNIFDPGTGLMRCKKTDGEFTEDFNQHQWFYGYTEGTSWQNSFFVPHDTEGFAALHGGKDALIKKMDELFALPPIYDDPGYETHEMSEMSVSDLGQCAISNQPSHHIPFIFAACGAPEKTAYWVGKICDEYFDSGVEGYPGDEDNGSMSSWYIFAMMGFYPYCPGKPEYVHFGSKLKSLKINGKPYDDKAHGQTVSHFDL